MCGKLLSAWLLLSFLPAYCLIAEQQYLITESQLQNIERLLEQSETDRQSWQQQAANLSNKLQTAEKTAKGLNNQLVAERERYSALETSFNRYEASQSEKMSELAREAAAERLEKERHKGLANTRLIAVIALAGAWVLFLGYKACRFLSYTGRLR